MFYSSEESLIPFLTIVKVESILESVLDPSLNVCILFLIIACSEGPQHEEGWLTRMSCGLSK